MRCGVRGLAFLAAVLAHVALVALLITPESRRGNEQIEAPGMVVVFIESETRRVTSEPLRSPAPSPRLPAPDVTPDLPRIDASSAISAAPDTPPEEAPTPPSVDWQQETRTAAARMAESLEAERQRNGKLAPDPRFARRAPRPQFGWDASKIHRIEALPEGGMIIHLSDRCILALNGLILPICKLGRIPARGDLFEHMGDTPASDEEP